MELHRNSTKYCGIKRWYEFCDRCELRDSVEFSGCTARTRYNLELLSSMSGRRVWFFDQIALLLGERYLHR